MLSFQEIITTLQQFWIAKGAILQQSHDVETGAGTFNPESFLRCLGPEPYSVCHVEISKRPTDGRYGENPNRLQRFHQFQVIFKPSPTNIQDLYLQSLEAIGFDLKKHDIRFVHDDWESPTQGASGLGWEVWCDGMEITQFTYFQMVGGIELDTIPVEIAYGIERLAMFLQGKKNVYDINYSNSLTYGAIYLQGEKEWCHYNFEEATVEMWKRHFEDYEREAKSLLQHNLPIPAYDFAIKASHAFNMMEARGGVSIGARVNLIHRIRDLACAAAKGYLSQREKLGFPLLDKRSIELPKKSLSPPPSFLKIKDDFLLEIGSEELPSSFIPEALIHLENMWKVFLQEKRLSYETLSLFGTPRRLGLYVKNLSRYSEEETLEKKGPGIAQAFDANGNLSSQGKGFLASVGQKEITLNELKKGEHPHLFIIEGKYLGAKIRKVKVEAFTLLQEFLPKSILDLPFPKKMRWSHAPISYARPIRWLIALFGKHIIPFSLGELSSSNISYGHKQIAPQKIKIAHPRKHFSKLRWYSVIADIHERKLLIEKQLDKLEKKFKIIATHKEEVLSEILYLSECPHLALHSFDEHFLTLPQELLESEMIEHQRYFPIQSSQGKLLNQFIVCVDKKPSELILKNNKAVLTARLTDGLFLYTNDCTKSLDTFTNKLKEISFHPEIGSLYDKTLRVKEIARSLANLLKEEAPDRASTLCKSDLATQVVYEFPHLQGIMGKYYALKQGESEETALAIEEHWWPLSEGSPIPTTLGGSILALADKLDNLIQFHQIGIKATSSKDPFALRRAAIGILRILIENRWSLDLSSLGLHRDILDFLAQRMRGLLEEHEFTKEEIAFVLSLSLNDPYDTYLRIQALHECRQSSDQFDKLFIVYKRAKGQIALDASEKAFDPSLIREEGERKLAHFLDHIQSSLDLSIQKKDYLKAFGTLASIEDPLNYFFDNVRVMTDDPKMRENRIALLQRVARYTKKLINLEQA